MDHYVRIIFNNNNTFFGKINESVFPNQNLLQTQDGNHVVEIPLDKSLTEFESDKFAKLLSDMLLYEGFKDFDIEITADEDNTEETYHGNDFFEAYGVLWYNDDDILDEAEYRGRKVKLGKPMRGDVKKFKVYVRDPKTKNVKKINFGDPNMRIKKSNPARRKSFRARHRCDNPGPRTKARYWSCRAW